MLDWERLSAVSVGPLLERRSARSIDFWPTRPAMVTAALPHPPRTAAALDDLGAPAKGLPALAQGCAAEAQGLRTIALPDSLAHSGLGGYAGDVAFVPGRRGAASDRFVVSATRAGQMANGWPSLSLLFN